MVTTNKKSTNQSLRRKKRIFGWVFIVSTLFLVFGGYFLISPEYYEPIIRDGEMAEAARKPESANNTIVVYISLITSIISLIGLLSTTILAWRKEKREITLAKLEIKKQELELEKLRMEAKN